MSYLIEQQENKALIKDLAGTVVAEAHDTSAGREFVKFVLWACDESEHTVSKQDITAINEAVDAALTALGDVRGELEKLI